MGTSTKWLVGIVILAITVFIIQLLTPWGAKTHSKKMGGAVASALEQGGFDRVEVAMSGNVAKLSGEVSSEAAANAALELAQNTAYPGHTVDQNWHEVDVSGLVVKEQLATVSPYGLRGTLNDDGALVLSGYASSDAARLAILAHGETLFPGKVIDDKIQLALGAPNGDWGAAANTHMDALAMLDTGSFVMEDGNTVLTGTASSADIRTTVNGLIAGLSAGYQGATNITVVGAAAENIGEIKSEDICQSLFESLKGDNKINFAYNRAEIAGASSLALLDSIASAATQCASFRVSIEGHTDAFGPDAYNLDLSQRRADAVLAHLGTRGVDLARVSGTGYGETKPVAGNDTPQGRAANRRIEFIVTRSN